MWTRPGTDEGGGPHDDGHGALLAMLGHELRTPLTGVGVGFVFTLLRAARAAP